MSDDIEGDLAQRVRSARKARGISQAQLGETLGVTALTVRRWEAGRNIPRGPAMHAKLRAFCARPYAVKEQAMYVAERDVAYGASWGSDDRDRDVLLARVMARIDWSVIEHEIAQAVKGALSETRAPAEPGSEAPTAL